MDNELLIKAFVEHYLNEDENSNRKRNKKGFWSNLFVLFQDDIIELYHNRKASSSVVFNYLKLSLSKCCDKEIVLENFISNKAYLSVYLNNYITSLEVISKDDTPKNNENTRYIPNKKNLNTKPISEKTKISDYLKRPKPIVKKPTEKGKEKTKYPLSFFADNKIAMRTFLSNRLNTEHPDFVDLMVDFCVLDYSTNPNPEKRDLSSTLIRRFFSAAYIYKSNETFKDLKNIFYIITDKKYTTLNYKDNLEKEDVVYKFFSEVEKRNVKDILQYEDLINEIIAKYDD